MKKVIKQWLALTLAIGAFVSCSDDRNEPSSTAEGGGESVTLSLSAEVSVDDADLRAINYKLGTNPNGAVVPLPQFTDGDLVEVHTIVKSSTGATAAKTLKWRYSAGLKKLVLRPEDGHSITVSGFNNDGGVKWYISGLIGGTLSGTKVTFEGKRELTGVAGNVGDAVGSLNVPYAFPWTEVVIDTSNSANTRDGNGSYKYAQVPSTANLKFAPQGSLIAYKLGTNQRAGAYTFTPTGFTVSSNAFGDKGTFELNTALPSNSTPTVLPAWTEGTPSALVYSFASGQEPGTIAHQQTADKTYYAWVMPHATQPASVVTRVTMKGDSSRPTTSTYRDYTKTWFTDYQVKASRLTNGHVHTLRANATHTYLLPIEYVTDYNLAGGEGLTYKAELEQVYYGNKEYLGGIQPIGIRGPLRFANYNPDGSENDHGHRNDMSGYYNYYRIMGLHDEIYNRQTKNLQAEVDATFGADKYFVPTADQWWGVFPEQDVRFSAPYSSPDPWDPPYVFLDRDECMAFGPGHDMVRKSYKSDYTEGFSDDNYNQDAVVYAIRFKARNIATPATRVLIYDQTSHLPVYTESYPSATDNSLKCAYRFTRVGGAQSYENAAYGNPDNLTNRLVIDVVYLGEEAVPTELDAISNAQWWADKKAEGLVISKIFPTSGVIYNVGSPNYLPDGEKDILFGRGYTSSFASSDVYYSARNATRNANHDPFYTTVMHHGGLGVGPGISKDRSVSVRLFQRRPY